MQPGETRSLCVGSSPEEARRAAVFCRQACAELFPPEECQAVELAIAEACNNVIEHAYRFRPDRPIWVTVVHEGDRLAFCLEDLAPPAFSLDGVSAPALEWRSLDDVPEGGWGVFIMRSVMDEVSYGQRRSRNHMRLAKRLPAGLCEPVPEVARSFGREEDARHAEIESLRAELATNEKTTNEMAEELSNTYERLNLFYSLSREVNRTLLDQDRLLHVILKRALQDVEARWGVLRLKVGDRLVRRVTLGPCPAVPETAPLTGEGIESRVAESGRETVTFAADRTPIMCLPITGLDEFFGTLLLGGTEDGDGFSAGDVKQARALADQAGVTLENHRLYDEAMSAKLARREMDIAHSLQQRLYPTDVPDIPGLRLFAEGQAARQVGGDYLALLPQANRRLDFVIADVMGKGMSAAFFSSFLHVAIRSILDLRPRASPGQILTVLNHIMTPDLDRFSVFMTALFGRVDLAHNRLSYACAGHPPPLLITPDGNCRLLETRDYMLGVNPGITYANLEAEFAPGMKLVAYTDGLTDVEDANGQMLGLDPVTDTCRRLADRPIRDIGRALMTAALGRAPGGELADDVAVIGVERLPAGATE